MSRPYYEFINSDTKRWLESAGITIVPIRPTVTPTEAAAYFEYVHGLFFHSGWADDPAYAATITLFLNIATAANRAGDYFPVWGTCQGFQRIVEHFGYTLEPLNARHFVTDKRLFLSRRDSRLLGFATKSQLRNLDAPYFNHDYGITVNQLKDTQVFKILATSHDREGIEYVAMIEGVTLPFYGVQFHPEQDSAGYTSHTWMAAFFAAELRKSGHTGFDPMIPVRVRN